MQEKEKKCNPKEEKKFLKNLFTLNKQPNFSEGLRVNLNKSSFFPPF